MTIEFISSSRISYAAAKSNLVKDLIRSSSFSSARQRAYIDELLRLEEFILEGVHGFASGMHYNHLKYRHPQEWSRIYEELKPDQFREICKREELEEAERKHEEEVRKADEKRWEERARQEWISLGGKP